jgi:hypothetical protein
LLLPGLKPKSHIKIAIEGDPETNRFCRSDLQVYAKYIINKAMYMSKCSGEAMADHNTTSEIGFRRLKWELMPSTLRDLGYQRKQVN